MHARKDVSLLSPNQSIRPAGLTCPVRRRYAFTSGLSWLPIAVCLLVAIVVSPAMAQIDLPDADPTEPVIITAEAANQWHVGSTEVWVVRGNCQISQGTMTARCREAALWIDHNDDNELLPRKLTAYLEGDVQVSSGPQQQASLSDQTWLGTFFTNAEIRFHVAQTAGEPQVMPPIYQRGLQRRDPAFAGTVRRTQYTGPYYAMSAPVTEGFPPGTRRILVQQRSDVPLQLKWFPSDPEGNERIAVIDGGVNMIVEGLDEYGVLDVSADRLVIWTAGLDMLDLSGEAFQDGQTPLEIYMEGNIVFRQSSRPEEQRVIRANRMYYDVTNRMGTVLGAEMLTPIEDYDGLLRLQAEVLQQTSRDTFFARNAFLTSSRMGSPGYRIEASEIYFEDIDAPTFDRWTGQQTSEHQRLATSNHNVLYLGPVPVFYWPTLATDLDDPTFFIRRIRLKDDRLYGTQVLTDWDVYELLGIRNPPEGTEWDLSLDYLGDRGFGHGTAFPYARDGIFGLSGNVSGLADFWGIRDNGLDNLGRGRNNLVPETDYRFRLFWQHRHQVSRDLRLSAELGWISDRNFLQQYYKREWDELKDQTTGVELKHLGGITSWSVTADVRLNDFFTQTEWLPRGDHFWLGQPLLNDAMTWYEHSHIGYARLRPTDTPDTALPAYASWNLLPWETTPRGGERLATRQEIDWPIQVGPVKLVPYALGELAHWGEDLTGDDLQRAYGRTGIRASMPMWRVDPTIESNRLNVHGIAHKVVFDAEFAFADASRDLTDLPLYDPLDDDSIEDFRRRLAIDTYAVAPVPARFDERFYALRSGIAGWVASPTTEIADDLITLRMGVRQRWQTKRGMPGNRRIIDWITLDTNLTWFPDGSRDNFGDALGLFDYDFRWHIGDRLTLLSDGIFDFFDDGQQIVTFGGYLSRPPRGSVYLGLRLLEGPISHQVLSLSYSYWMSPKWISWFGTSFDLGDEGNLGQRFGITRIGESLLVSAGFTVDAALDNVGVNLAIEPRFLPKGRLGRVGGVRVPVAGAYGLE